MIKGDKGDSKITIHLEGKSREDARKIIIGLERNKLFFVDKLEDGRYIYIKTDGRKKSFVDGKEVKKKLDFTVHHDGETRNLNYVDDLLMDVMMKNLSLGEKNTIILVQAIKDSIELIPIDEIYEKYPKLSQIKKMNLPGHSIDFLLRIIRWLGLQEDVNYWGVRPSGKKYEGREKPYHALRDLMIFKDTMFNVLKKHMLITSYKKR